MEAKSQQKCNAIRLAVEHTLSKVLQIGEKILARKQNCKEE